LIVDNADLYYFRGRSALPRIVFLGSLRPLSSILKRLELPPSGTVGLEFNGRRLPGGPDPGM